MQDAKRGRWQGLSLWQTLKLTIGGTRTYRHGNKYADKPVNRAVEKARRRRQIEHGILKVE